MTVDERFKDPSLTSDQRKKLIREVYPSTHQLDWGKALAADIDLFGRVLRDVLKVGVAPQGRSGPRQLDYHEGMADLRRLQGEDYSSLPFHEAFQVLAAGRSLTTVARKTGLSRSRANRLLKGEVQPDLEAMEKIAAGFRKDPSYFAEYRTRYIASFVERGLMDSPESSIGVYRKIKAGVSAGH